MQHFPVSKERLMFFTHGHSLSQRQSLVVGQQLRQAIVLLQMGNPELQSFIEQQAEENPFVELAPTRAAPAPIQQGMAGGRGDDVDQIAALADTRGPSLYTHVANQIAALGLTEAEIELATVFVDALEPSGWLGASLDAIAARAGVDLSDANAMLARLQRLEPVGLFARSLSECLRLQAAEQGLLTPLFATVLDNLPLLAAADLPALARLCRCHPDDLRAVLRDLRSLDPKPGAGFDASPDPIRPPDLIVTAAPGGGWQIELNRSTLPRVRIDDRKAATLARDASQTRGVEHAQTRSYVTERLSVARWLSRAVEHRNRTVLKIGQAILQGQPEFLQQGPAHLRPMILREIADQAGVHESTVSRVTTGILMATPHGTFPLKHFFTAALAAQDDSCASAGSVRHRIARMIKGELPGKPLSDDQIVRMMQAEGVTVARRTVAKYREQMHIPGSSTRRRQAILSGHA
jgi:RNA polymerase sigma-54 factor